MNPAPSAPSAPSPPSPPSPPLTARSAHRRFLALTALRWAPTGLLVPVLVLLPLDRGIGLAHIGLAASVQGFIVFFLELPTGGLADTIGRRGVLVASMVVSIVSVGVLLVADTFALLAVVFALQGAYRALDSGPLEAWYVDAALADDPGAPIHRGLSHYGTIVGLAIGGGALASGGLVALAPLPSVNPLVLPVAVGLALQVLALVAVLVLMTEPRYERTGGAVRRALRETPRTIGAGVTLLRGSPVLLALVLVEVAWGFGSATYETLLPVRLAEVLGGREAAGAVTGPAASVAWIAAAAGAASTPWLMQRIGVAPTAALGRVAQGATVVGIGVFGGLAGILVAYLACYTVHGVSNAAHSTLLHRQATGDVRATVVSINSMLGQPAGSLGLILLTAAADGVSVTGAMVLGGTALAVAAPLYLPAWRQERGGTDPVSAAAVSRSATDVRT